MCSIIVVSPNNIHAQGVHLYMSIVPYRKVSDKWETYKAQSLIVAEKLQQIIARERIGDNKHYY